MKGIGVRKIIKSFSSQTQKKTLLGAMFIIALFLFAPFSFAHANFITDGVINLLFIIPSTILSVVYLAITQAMDFVIHWLMSIHVTPCNPADPLCKTPEFIHIGWQLSRDLVNMVLLVILAFLGLATILRLKAYETQKIIPSLLIVALLVNFSGLLVGLFADIGNIITNAFLGYAKGDWSDIQKGFAILDNSPGQTIGMILYYLLASLIFFIVMLVFMVRVMILWTLAILAPLACVAYILPATKKFWDHWLHALIEWSLIGIPIAFFLYLSKMSLTLGHNMGDTAGVLGWVQDIFAPLTSVFLMGLGVMIAQQLAPASAKMVIDFGKKAGMTTGKWAAKKSASFARDRLRESLTAGGLIDRMNKWSAIKPSFGKQLTSENAKGPIGWIRRAGQSTAQSVVGYGLRAIPLATKKLVTDADTAEGAAGKADAAKSDDMLTNLGKLNGSASNAAKVGIITVMADKGQLKDAMDPTKAGPSVLTQERLLDIYKDAQRMKNKDSIKAIERSSVGNKTRMAKLAEIKYTFMDPTKRSTDKRYEGLTIEEVASGMTSLTDKAVSECKTEADMKQLNEDWYKGDPEALQATYKHWGGSQFGAAEKTFHREFVDEINKNQHTADWYLEKDGKGRARNAAGATYFANTASGSFGYIGLTGGEGTEQLKKKKRELDQKYAKEHPHAPTAETMRTAETRLEELESKKTYATKKERDELAELRQTLPKMKTLYQDPSVVSADALLKEISAYEEQLKALEEESAKKQADLAENLRHYPPTSQIIVNAQKEINETIPQDRTRIEALRTGAMEEKARRGMMSNLKTENVQTREDYLSTLVAGLRTGQVSQITSPDADIVETNRSWEEAAAKYRETRVVPLETKHAKIKDTLHDNIEEQELLTNDSAKTKDTLEANEEIYRKCIEELNAELKKLEKDVELNPLVQQLKRQVYDTEDIHTREIRELAYEQAKKRVVANQQNQRSVIEKEIENATKKIDGTKKLAQTKQQGITEKLNKLKQAETKANRELATLEAQINRTNSLIHQALNQAANAIQNKRTNYSPPAELRSAWDTTKNFRSDLSGLQDEATLAQEPLQKANFDQLIKKATTLPPLPPQAENGMPKELKKDIKESEDLFKELARVADALKAHQEELNIWRKNLEQNAIEEAAALEGIANTTSEEDQEDLQSKLTELRTESRELNTNITNAVITVQDMATELNTKKQEFEEFQADHITNDEKKYQEDKKNTKQEKTEEETLKRTGKITRKK